MAGRKAGPIKELTTGLIFKNAKEAGKHFGMHGETVRAYTKRKKVYEFPYRFAWVNEQGKQ